MRNIVFIRHGKAQPKLWANDTPEDHTNRHLTDLGVAQAQEVGAWLKAQGAAPDYIVCSTATRTVETCKQVLIGMNIETVPTTFDDNIYYGEVALIATTISKAPQNARTLFVIGHNPTLPMTAQYFDGGNNRDLYEELHHRFNLAAVAWVEVPESAVWAALKPGDGRLRATYEPIQLESLGKTSASPL